MCSEMMRYDYANPCSTSRRSRTPRLTLLDLEVDSTLRHLLVVETPNA